MIISPIGILILVLAHDVTALKIFGSKVPKNISKRLKAAPGVFFIILFITLFIGFFYGAIFAKFKDKTKLPSKEMENRSNNKGLWESFLVAVVCAVALPKGFKHDDTALLMAIGIATALLPPLVNIGVTYGVHYSDENRMENSNQKVRSAFKFSSLIFIINFLTLSLGVYAYMRLTCVQST